jgi:hypothetical protein
MTIDEAIKMLKRQQNFRDTPEAIDIDDAIKLGIEALKEVKKARWGDPALDGELLRGETEE